MFKAMSIISRIGTVKTVALSIATAGVIGGTVAGVAIHNGKSEMLVDTGNNSNSVIQNNATSKTGDVYVVGIESARDVTALSIYNQLVATGDLVLGDNDTVLLSSTNLSKGVSVTYGDGTEKKDFLSAGEYSDKLIISESASIEYEINIKVVVRGSIETSTTTTLSGTTQTETSVTSTETTSVTGVSTSVTSVTSVTGVVTSVITDTQGNEVQVIEVNEDQNTDDDNNVDINNSNEDSNTDNNNNSASGSVTKPVSKPQPTPAPVPEPEPTQPTTKAPDPIPEPEPEPTPEPTPEPIPEPDPEPIIEDDNSGYPEGFESGERRANYDYAVSMGCDEAQAVTYCVSVEAFGKDRVVIGIPEGGEEIGMYWAVWTLVDEENGIWQANGR